METISCYRILLLYGIGNHVHHPFLLLMQNYLCKQPIGNKFQFGKNNIDLCLYLLETYSAVADPGFPVGGVVHPLGGGVDLRCGFFSVKMDAKTKELGPIGGGVRPARPLDPPMQCQQYRPLIQFLLRH